MEQIKKCAENCATEVRCASDDVANFEIVGVNIFERLDKSGKATPVRIALRNSTYLNWLT